MSLLHAFGHFHIHGLEGYLHTIDHFFMGHITLMAAMSHLMTTAMIHVVTTVVHGKCNRVSRSAAGSHR
ncbi:hypothetical protein GEOBRER4_n1398 [Citrifermentans bremense]|uniref:Uncharacterized protein n=1 Tax=Citrifermentans bremense TaxID=60035 RepID=A0A7R7IYQ1_9BACT|nr:hypothetical protein GEOBRER4_n1398 [Citrifermentans bremense]